MTQFSTAHVRVITFNTHVGSAVAGLRNLLRQFPDVDIVCLQEVQSRRAKVRVRAVMRPTKWIKGGPGLASPAGTLVYVRRSEFKRLANYNKVITKGPASGMQPMRALSGGVFLHKKTGRVFDITSGHTWAMGKGLQHSNLHVRNNHIRQGTAIARQHTPLLGSELIVELAAGDWNEKAGEVSKSPDSIRYLFSSVAGMQPTAQLTKSGDRSINIDEVFIGPRSWLKVLNRRHANSHDRHADHPAVFVELLVEGIGTQFNYAPVVARRKG